MRTDEIVIEMIAATVCLSLLMIVGGAVTKGQMREWKGEDGGRSRQGRT